MSEKAGK